jgi:NADPH:quinone reductase-like Zn-dependent oxidoreductase
MRAVAVRKFRAPPELMDLPPPKPAAGELLVRLDAASVNPFDWKIIDGILDGVMPHTFPLVLGIDGAGVVESTGANVARFRPGDLVFGQFTHPPIGIGTYAEYATVPELLGIAKVPAGLTPVEAAAIPTAGMTAMVLLDALGLAKGQRLLIVGATGGIGSFAIPLAVARGARVIAVTQSSKAAYLRARGASEIIDRSRGSVLDQVRSSHPEGVDALLMLAGDPAAFAANSTLVRDGGVAATPVSGLFGEKPPGQRIRFVATSMTPSALLLDRVTTEILSGKLPIPVETIVPLEKAPDALADSRTGNSLGKTCIKIR